MEMKTFRWFAVFGVLLLVITIGGCGGSDEPNDGGASHTTPPAQQEPAAQPEPPEPTTPAAKPVASDPFLKLETVSSPAEFFPTIDSNTCALNFARFSDHNRSVLQVSNYDPLDLASQKIYPRVMFRCELSTSGSLEERAGQELEGILFVQQSENSPVWQSLDDSPAKLTFAPVEPETMLETFKIQGTIRGKLRSTDDEETTVSGEFLAEDMGNAQ